jgi:Flp pilus assembly protein TadD
LLGQRAYYQRIGPVVDAEALARDAEERDESKELAAYWMEHHYFDDAVYVLLRAVKASPGDSSIHRDLAYLFAQKKFLVPAHAHINEAMTLGAKDVKTFYTAGIVHMWLGENDEARTYLTKALEIDPENQEVKLALQTLEGTPPRR